MCRPSILGSTGCEPNLKHKNGNVQPCKRHPEQERKEVYVPVDATSNADCDYAQSTHRCQTIPQGI